MVEDTKGNVIATEIFNFSGSYPEIEIVDYEIGWAWLGTCLAGINFRIRNTGDLPFYVREIKVFSNGKSGRYLPGVEVEPHKEIILKTYAESGSHSLVYGPGEQPVTLKFIAGDTVVYSMSTTIIVPEKPPVG